MEVEGGIIWHSSERYSVSWIYCKKRVDLHLSEGKIFIILDDKEIANHKLIEGKHQCSVNKEHFSGLFKPKYSKGSYLPPQHDPHWWNDVAVMVRELNYYEQAVQFEGEIKSWQ